MCFCWLCLLHPNRKPHWPAPGELRASPFRGRLRSARYARLRSAAPGRGAQVAKNTITEQTLHRRLCGETGEVTRILRQLQTIRLGSIHLKNEGLQILQQITKVPADLNAQLAQLKLLHLFAAPPAWAKNAEPTQP